jgi:HEAT repeat protein
MTMKRYAILSVLTLIAAVAVANRASAADVSELEQKYLQTIDRLLPGMGAKEIPARKDPQQELERLCFASSGPGKEAEREALCRAIIARVGPEVAYPARIWLLRKLETLGRHEVVAELTKLLTDPDEHVRETARRALANNPAPKAAVALRNRLTTTDDDAERIAMMNALGWRHDAESVPAIVGFIRSNHDAVATAAVHALGSIGTQTAVETLLSLMDSERAAVRNEAIDAALRAADRIPDKDLALKVYESLDRSSRPESIRIAALEGMARAQGPAALPRLMQVLTGEDSRLQLAAARCIQRIEGNRATRELLAAMDRASPLARARILDVLAQRGDAQGRSVAMKSVEDRDADVRLSAIRALRALGDSSAVRILAQRAARGDEAEQAAARDALVNLKGQDTDQVIVNALDKTQGPVRAELIKAAAARRIATAEEVLYASANDPNEAVRVAVFSALATLGDPADLPRLVSLLVKSSGERTLKAAADAVGAVSMRMDDAEKRAEPIAAALSAAPAGAQIVLLDVMARVQGNTALAAVRKAMQSEDPGVKAAATQALSRWKAAYITSWLFSGPYRQEGKGPKDYFDTPYPPEDPQAEVDWKPLKAGRRESPGEFLLHKVAPGDNCVGYVKTTLYSDREQDVVLTFGSDDGIKVWLNGQIAHANNAIRGTKCGEDSVKAKLKEGENTLLLKITQGGSDWSFCAGVKASDGGPADGLRFQAH